MPQTPPGYQPQPQWQPQWTPPPQQFYPQPPTYPVDRERLLEIEAAKRGWDKEDFRKIVELTDEMSELKIRRIKAESDARYTALERETRRNSELNALLADPFFTNPKVQFEMHKVFEENPQAFSLEPQPYVYAFNEAQKRLGRQFLQDGPMESEHVPSLPTKPPVDPGKASTPAFEQSKESKILEEFNNAKSADEQKQILSRLGRVPTI